MITIRTAQPGDVAALTILLRGLNWFERMANEPLDTTEAIVSSHLRQCLADSSHSIFIAENQSEGLVGYIAVHWLPYLFMAGPEGFISELFVREAARGDGVGRRLLEAVTQEARQRGCFRLSLLNGRHRESYQRKFYEKRGWKERPNMVNFVYIMPEMEEN